VPDLVHPIPEEWLRVWRSLGVETSALEIPPEAKEEPTEEGEEGEEP